MRQLFVDLLAGSARLLIWIGTGYLVDAVQAHLGERPPREVVSASRFLTSAFYRNKAAHVIVQSNQRSQRISVCGPRAARRRVAFTWTRYC